MRGPSSRLNRSLRAQLKSQSAKHHFRQDIHSSRETRLFCGSVSQEISPWSVREFHFPNLNRFFLYKQYIRKSLSLHLNDAHFSGQAVSDANRKDISLFWYTGQRRVWMRLLPHNARPYFIQNGLSNSVGIIVRGVINLQAQTHVRDEHRRAKRTITLLGYVHVTLGTYCERCIRVTSRHSPLKHTLPPHSCS